MPPDSACSCPSASMATAGSVVVFRLDGTPRSFRRFVSWVFVRLHPNEFEADPKDPFKGLAEHRRRIRRLVFV